MRYFDGISDIEAMNIVRSSRKVVQAECICGRVLVVAFDGTKTEFPNLPAAARAVGY